ncbi:MAG: hypothetical protein M3Q22_04895 [Actinomycetota bacterium]|nr:hypothetical protein [Actinomycetota bacterium]
MNVTGIVVIDLTRLRLQGRDAASTARGAIWRALADAPVSVDVRLVVPAWDWWAPAAASALLDHEDDINTVVVESDAATVRQWVLALRYGVGAAEPLMRR